MRRDCSISFVSWTDYIKKLMSSLFEEDNGFAHAAGRPAHATGTRHPQHGRHPTKPRIMMRLLARLGVRNPQGKWWSIWDVVESSSDHPSKGLILSPESSSPYCIYCVCMSDPCGLFLQVSWNVYLVVGYYYVMVIPGQVFKNGHPFSFNCASRVIYHRHLNLTWRYSPHPS